MAVEETDDRTYPGFPACRTTLHQTHNGELLQHTSVGVVLVVAAVLALTASGQCAWCNTCGLTTWC